MRKYLLPKDGHDYRANLHCHSTLSDGKLTPEELKQHYKNEGYAILAYTDHDIMIDHSDLADEDFLPLRGYELEVGQLDGRPGTRKTCHMCFIALSPDNRTQALWHREKYLFANAVNYRDQVQFDPSLPDYERYYTVERITDMMQTGREKGFFVTYNHPAWSLETYEQYARFRGMHAMEICNYGCICNGYDDYNPTIYDDILRAGNRIYCIAADDNHSAKDCFGGFTVIRAEKLEYSTVTKALLDGHFYASMGPRIHDLYVEDDKVHITCEPVRAIALHCGRRKCRKVSAPEGEYITEASFVIEPENDVYFRLSVEDAKGYRANTNAYFCDEVFAPEQV